MSPSAFTLVHASGRKKALFAPTRLMNPVTYLGRTQGNDIVLTSDNVSRRHAKLVVTDSGITVHDLDSHNGIFLNGKKVRSTPVNVGDLLYIADVCIEVRKNADADETGVVNTVKPGHDEITGEEDPAIRSLATLLRASEIVSLGDDDAFAIQAIELCRELTEATVAVLIDQDDGGPLETPVVLQPESGKKGDVPVLWPIVRKALDDGIAQFSGDLKRHPIVRDEAVQKSDVGAVMAVPISVDGAATGAIYLSRSSPGQVFTERELDVVAAIAALFASRRRPVEVSAAALEPHGDIVSARAKAEAAEEKLREGQADIRSLTERIHGLEADALRLKQQIEIEKQNALDAKREADRGRTEASKLEQGLHKTDEDVKKLRDALQRSEEERQKLKEALKVTDEERRQRGGELEKVRDLLKQNDVDRDKQRGEIADHVRAGQEREDELGRAHEELARLMGELERIRTETSAGREDLERVIGEHAAHVEALKQAMRATVPPMMAEHVEGTASGAPIVTAVTTSLMAALYVALQGFDAWAQTGDPADVKRRLDHFCNSVALRARANGGRVQQVLGHAHFLVFPADAASVRNAVRCALEVAALVPPEGAIGVTSALHVGNSASGFFGEGDTATLVETGEALFVARGIAALAHEPTLLTTGAVQKLVAGDPSFTFAMMGPAALVGGPTVTLFRVSATDGSGGAT